ncbi:SAM-dependent methyltransferase [Bacillus sonorensis]|nr:SAM-dependent methyltransferase [Bacillus sonorensis]
MDIGSGGGKTIHALYIITEYGKLYGIDYLKQAVKDSIRTNWEDVETCKVNIRQASVSDIPFPGNAFDIVTACQTHYFWSDLENDVKEVFRVLKQDGKFMILAELYNINYHMKSCKTTEEMKQLFFISVEFYENKNKGWLCIIGFK